MQGLQKKEFEHRLQQVEGHLQEVGALEGTARGSATEAVRALLDLHGTVLDRMLEIVAERDGAGGAILESFASDGMVSGLLLLHGLHPHTLEERVRGALARVRPYLGSHGGNVELVELREGVARLRLEGSCHGCPSSTMTLRYAIEREIAEAAPDLVDLQVDGVAERPPAAFIPLGGIAGRTAPAPAIGDWLPVPGVAGVEEDRVVARSVDGRALLFCRVGGAHYAYRDGCPGCSGSLAGARLGGGVLRCGACGRAYDVRRAGRGLDGTAPGLTPIPLLVEEGEVRIALEPALEV